MAVRVISLGEKYDVGGCFYLQSVSLKERRKSISAIMTSFIAVRLLDKIDFRVLNPRSLKEEEVGTAKSRNEILKGLR